MTLVLILAGANIFVLGMFAGRRIGRRETESYYEALASDCPNCRHYGSACDVCATEKRSEEGQL